MSDVKTMNVDTVVSSEPVATLTRRFEFANDSLWIN